MASFSYPTNNALLKIESGDGLGGSSGNFTVEAWGYLDNPAGSAWNIFYGCHDYGSTRRTQLGIAPSGSDARKMYATFDDTGFGYGGDFTASTWHHIAWVREGSNLAYFLDGSRVAHVTWTVGALYNNSSAPVVGYDNSTNLSTYQSWGTNGGDCWLDQIRVSNIARYSGTTYDVPSEAFSTDANTNVLVQSENWNGSGTSFTATTGGTITLLKSGTSYVSNDGDEVDYGGAGSGFLSLNSKQW
tara:strand:- start:62 stop:793 length:732 start_codon:yes stop_codon:yes gene_type:complete